MAKATIKGLTNEMNALKKKLGEFEKLRENDLEEISDLAHKNRALQARIDDGIKLFKEQEGLLGNMAAMRSIIERSTRTLSKLACGHEQYDNAAKMRQTAAETLEQIVQMQNGIEARGGPRRFFGMDFAK